MHMHKGRAVNEKSGNTVPVGPVVVAEKNGQGHEEMSSELPFLSGRTGRENTS